MGKREEMRRAIEANKSAKSAAGKRGAELGKQIVQNIKKGLEGVPVVAAAATPKKPNPRSAKARDLRMKHRGRLPNMTHWEIGHHECVLSVEMNVGYWIPNPEPGNGGKLYQSVSFRHGAKGLFEALEAIDVKFWKWLADPANKEIASKFEFPKSDIKPDVFPKEGGATDEQKA